MINLRSLLFSGLLVLVALPLSAQEKRALEHSDYDIWNRIQSQQTSADGSWLAYRLVPGDGDGVLNIRELGGNGLLTVDRGGAPVFAPGSGFVVALISPMDAAVKEAKKEDVKSADQPKDSLVVVDLGDLSGSLFKVEKVKSFKVPEDGSAWMAYLLEASSDEADEADEDEAEAEAEAEEEAEEEGEEEKEAPRTDDGATLVVRDLESGAERRFEYVVSYDFSENGSVLYYTASGEDGAADGVFRVRPSGAADTVSAGEGRYLKLTVSEQGAVAFLTDRDDRDSEAPDFGLYTAERSGNAEGRAALSSPGLPTGWAPSEHGDVSFSESGARVFFGSALAPEPEPEDETPEDERVVVDIWNWKDPYLQPMQLLQADDERNRSYQAMVDLATGTVVQLADETMPTVSVAQDGDGDRALGTSDLPYRQLISWDGRYADLYSVDVAGGTKHLVAEMVRGRSALSPDGKYTYWFDGYELAWFAVDMHSFETINLTGSMDVPFHDALDDHPDALRSYGSAGWTEGDEAFVVYDEHDIWMIDPTQREAPRNVTEGAGRAGDVRFRYVRLDPDLDYVPTRDDVLLSAFHLTTKSAGYYEDRFEGSGEPKRLVWDDVLFGSLRKAEDADRLIFTKQTFQDFPNLWVADGDFGDMEQVTDANPQQAEYSWGTAELVEWTSNDGIPLQGILYKPEDFDPTQEYPMMVYFYERNSHGLHRHVVPSAGGSSINYSFYVSRGYLLFVPDIPYRIGYPGESAIDAVLPGILSVVAQGFVDRDHIGVQGHSWGGYQIAYMITRTDLFAAAEAGAPVSNMVSAYGGIRWGSGMSRAFQYERTQTRIGGSLWETPLRYIENSPIFTADKINTPLLMLHNDKDTAVPWYQGIELFVGMRRLQKPVWMLNYNGEPHGLRKAQNRKDWAIRMQQFFDHYLRDAPVPVWMDEGVPAVLKGKTLGLEIGGS